jgi:hypothetical protein
MQRRQKPLNKSARKMRGRDKVIILFVLVMGLTIAGFQLFLQAMVHRWELIQHPAEMQQEQRSELSEGEEATHAFPGMSKPHGL